MTTTATATKPATARKPAARKPAASRNAAPAKPAETPAGKQLAALLGGNVDRPKAGSGAASMRASAERAAAPKAPSKLAQQRTVATALIKASADFADKWNERKTGVPADVVLQCVAKWMNYIPGEWDERLGARTDAGRRKS